MNFSTYPTIYKYTTQKRGLHLEINCHTSFFCWASLFRTLANWCQQVVDSRTAKGLETLRQGRLNEMGYQSGNELMGFLESLVQRHSYCSLLGERAVLFSLGSPLSLIKWEPQKDPDPQNQPVYISQFLICKPPCWISVSAMPNNHLLAVKRLSGRLSKTRTDGIPLGVLPPRCCSKYWHFCRKQIQVSS